MLDYTLENLLEILMATKMEYWYAKLVNQLDEM